jgi:hypothetical protein
MEIYNGCMRATVRVASRLVVGTGLGQKRRINDANGMSGQPRIATELVRRGVRLRGLQCLALVGSGSIRSDS